MVPALFCRDRRRIHPGGGGADSKVRAVPGTSDICPHGGDFLDAGFEWVGKLLEPQAGGTIAGEIVDRVGSGRGSCRRDGGGGFTTCGGRRGMASMVG